MKKLIFCLILANWGCTGTETGNPNAEVDLLVNARSSNLTAVSLRQTGGAVVVEQAWLTLDKLSFSQGANCAGTPETIQTPSLGLGDHSGPDALKLKLNVTPGVYCQATTAFMNGQVQKPLGAPEEVLDHSIVIVGRLADGTPLKIASNFAALVRLDASTQPFEWGVDETALLLEFDLARWLKDLDFSAAVRDPVAGIVLSESANSEMLGKFEGNVAPGVELFRDVAKNGDVDPEDTKAAGGSL